MEANNEAVLELAKSIQSLSDNIVTMEIVIIVTGLVSAGFMWFIIKYYENATNDRADEFSVRKADRLDNTDNIDELLEYCLKFREKYPNDMTVNFYLGLAYYRKQQFLESRKYFKKSAELNPNMRQNVEGYLEVIEKELTIPADCLKN
ncbi:MAG: tetratricopeptide repeat protein [Marinobacter sp.]|uniref:tetratricopeptide repeat protein n=1 Tax=Marinobacter sp. TaxID=50741 RepID=UPI00396D4336